jgi:hypothetical protein
MQSANCKNADLDAAPRVNCARVQPAWLRSLLCVPVAFCVLHSSGSVTAQQLIDRVLARVGTSAVTMTDVRAAIELGLVEAKPGEDRQAVALQRTIERRLVLDEVARFAPPEPSAEAVMEEAAAMKARAGARFEALVLATGVDEAKLRQLARETLRIRAYVAQRFGTTAQVTVEEARKYYEEHPEAFTRDGVRMPFEQSEAEARQRASAERLRVTIDQWVQDLSKRAEVVIVGGTAAPR